MHTIISNSSSKIEIGSKTLSLIKLDKLGPCPNFIVIDHNTLKEEFEVSRTLGSELLNWIEQELSCLNINPPIVRASSINEDSKTLVLQDYFNRINAKQTSHSYVQSMILSK